MTDTLNQVIGALELALLALEPKMDHPKHGVADAKFHIKDAIKDLNDMVARAVPSEIPDNVKQALENAANMASKDADYCETQHPPINGPTCLRLLAMKLRGLAKQPVHDAMVATEESLRELIDDAVDKDYADIDEISALNAAEQSLLHHGYNAASNRDIARICFTAIRPYLKEASNG